MRHPSNFSGSSGSDDHMHTLPRDQWMFGNTPPPDIKALWGPPIEGPVPRGNYLAVIRRTSHGRSINNHPYFALVFQITHGPYRGRCFEYRLWLTTGGIDRTKACCAKFGVFRIEDLYEIGLAGRTCRVFIDARKEDPETEIKSFDPIDLPVIDDGEEGGVCCGAD